MNLTREDFSKFEKKFKKIMEVVDEGSTSYRDQHYLPKFYMRGFADRTIGAKEFIWVHSCASAPSQRLIKDVACLPYFNSFKDTDGKIDVTFEKFFSTFIETPAAVVIRNRIRNSLPLTFEDRTTLITFISSLMTRTPYFREHLKKTLNAQLHDHAATHPNTKTMYEFVRSGAFSLGVTQFHLIERMMDLGGTVFKMLWPRTLTVLSSATAERFITSDIGFAIKDNGDPRRWSPRSRSFRFFVPLTSEKLAVISNGNAYTEGYRKADRFEANEINSLVAEQSEAFVLASQKDVSLPKYYGRELAKMNSVHRLLRSSRLGQP